MKFLSVLLLAAAGTTLAKGDGKGKHKGASAKAECGEIEKITHLVDLAANATKLDEVTKGNTTKAAEIQAKASPATTKLQTLESNATLMTTCNAVFAEKAMDRACAKMASIEELIHVAANQTLLDKKSKGNATRAAEIQAKASAEAGQLATMEGNTTLTAFCSQLDTKHACKSMKHLQKEVDRAQNQTALETEFNGNATKIAAFQAKASKAATKLAEMQSNSTLMNACAAIACGFYRGLSRLWLDPG